MMTVHEEVHKGLVWIDEVINKLNDMEDGEEKEQYLVKVEDRMMTFPSEVKSAILLFTLGEVRRLQDQLKGRVG